MEIEFSADWSFVVAISLSICLSSGLVGSCLHGMEGEDGFFLSSINLSFILSFIIFTPPSCLIIPTFEGQLGYIYCLQHSAVPSFLEFLEQFHCVFKVLFGFPSVLTVWVALPFDQISDQVL